MEFIMTGHIYEMTGHNAPSNFTPDTFEKMLNEANQIRYTFILLNDTLYTPTH